MRGETGFLVVKRYLHLLKSLSLKTQKPGFWKTGALYAHPIWNESQAAKAKLDVKVNGTVDITLLLIERSHKTYGVSKKHETVMKAMPSLKGHEDKIFSITNGVSVRDWQDAEYQKAGSLSDEDLIRLKEKKKA